MSIPNYEYYMLPLLRIVATEKSIYLNDAISKIKEQEQYSDNELILTIKNGRLMIDDRIAWARTYLKKALLIDQNGRGVPLCIRNEGQILLNKMPTSITKKFLYDNYAPFREWIDSSTNQNQQKIVTEIQNLGMSSETTPDEKIFNSYDELKQIICSELLEQVIQVNPYRFESMVLDLLVSMGYGKASGTLKSNDEGIDGIINKDALGIEKIYIQVKRYKLENKVGRPSLQSFMGSILNKDSKGLFITTSDFTSEAIEYAKNVNLTLINGKYLAELMFDYNIGVQTRRMLEIKSLDYDYFEFAE